MPLTRRLFLLSTVAAAATRPVFAGDTPELNLSRSGLAVRGVDLVSYFTVGSPQKGRKDISVNYKGGTYRFLSAENKALFEKDPERYLPAYGGFCAYWTAVNAKVNGDPYVWHIVDGQLYFNITRSVDRVWQRNIPKYIKDANNNWPDLKFTPA